MERRIPQDIGDHPFDLIVVGGGINGVGTARDAAMRGLKVLLLDKGDFGSGTTSWSSRLIHGGLRYLEFYEFYLVRESLSDREKLLRIAPHLVKPLLLAVPIYDHSSRGPAMIRLGMTLYDVLSFDKRRAVLALLVDGNSVRATSRITGVHPDTITRFVVAVGVGAQHLHNKLVRNLAATTRIECDEMWAYVRHKDSSMHKENPPTPSPGSGDAWIWVAVDPVSRLVISWYVGKRDQASANAFMCDVRARLAIAPQITSDGLANYPSAIRSAFDTSVDYAQLVKVWQQTERTASEDGANREQMLKKKIVFGAPNMANITTAHVERNHLTARHMNGRLRRKCLAFSKKLDNHRAALALSYTWFNLGRVQRGIRVTPAMAAGVTDHIWDLDEFLTAILTAEPYNPPEKQPLKQQVPEGTHRELPGGRGFLRVVGKGGPPQPAKPTQLRLFPDVFSHDKPPEKK